MNLRLLALLVPVLLFVASCKPDTPPASTKTETAQPKIVKIPSFQGQNAYNYVEEQLAFGYRYPGSEGHTQVIEYLHKKLESYGADVQRQNFKVDFLGKTDVPATNIIATYNPEMNKRVLLAAHFDSRLVAEKDTTRQDQPIMGADDGASGVAVLLEIARLIHENGIELGVDIILFDAEDQGIGGEDGPQDTWCLGAQHWSKNPHEANYKAKYGILLDMVGAQNARFGKEAISMQAAPQLMNKVWRLAQNMGYSNYFQDFDAGGVMDDHYYVILNRKIPMIDIINRPVGETDHGFGHYHHTHADNIDIIDPNTLKAVGKVVTAVIYNESMGRF